MMVKDASLKGDVSAGALYFCLCIIGITAFVLSVIIVMRVR
jgi:hypothetical protein